MTSATRGRMLDGDRSRIADLNRQLYDRAWEAAPQVWADAFSIPRVSHDGPPVYLYHGQTDGLVDIEHARRSARALTEAGVKVTLDELRGGHFPVFLNGRDVEVRATVFLEDLSGSRPSGREEH